MNYCSRQMKAIIKIFLTVVVVTPQIFAQTGGDTLFTENSFLYHNNCSVLFYDTKDSLIHETANLGHKFGINFKLSGSLETADSANDTWLYMGWTTNRMDQYFSVGLTIRHIRFFRNFIAEEQRRILQPANF